MLFFLDILHCTTEPIIIRDQKIAAAQAILPLADTPHVQKNLGTRHRAAVGLSIASDAVVIVASEENGKVSHCARRNYHSRYKS